MKVRLDVQVYRRIHGSNYVCWICPYDAEIHCQNTITPKCKCDETSQVTHMDRFPSMQNCQGSGITLVMSHQPKVTLIFSNSMIFKHVEHMLWILNVPLIHCLEICEVPKTETRKKIGGSFLVEQSQFNLQIGSSFPSRHNNVWTHDLGPTSTFNWIDTGNLVPATINEMWNYAQLWSNDVQWYAACHIWHILCYASQMKICLEIPNPSCTHCCHKHRLKHLKMQQTTWIVQHQQPPSSITSGPFNQSSRPSIYMNNTMSLTINTLLSLATVRLPGWYCQVFHPTRRVAAASVHGWKLQQRKSPRAHIR